MRNAFLTTSVSGFASNIYFPAILTISHDLGVSVELVNLTVTSYLIFQGLAPSLWGPISDVKGRRVAYCCTFLVFIGACAGLALSNNYSALVVLRCLQSTGSASTIAIGSGVIGDITTREERGGYMGIFQAGLLVPVAIGPVIGGALAGRFGWHSIFWFLTIYSSIFLLLLISLLPETLRAVVGNGSCTTTSHMRTFPLSIYQRFTKVGFHKAPSGNEPLLSDMRIDLLGPLRILTCAHAAPIIVFLAIYYAVWQMSITAMSTLFEQKYDLTETQVGLTFIANGIGSTIGTLCTGKILDIDFRRVSASHIAHVSSQDNLEANCHITAQEGSFPSRKRASDSSLCSPSSNPHLSCSSRGPSTFLTKFTSRCRSSPPLLQAGQLSQHSQSS